MDHHEWLREQMLDFFGPAGIDVNSATTEDELISIYKAELKRRARLRYVADCAILNPKLDRTWFRLVVAGQHEKVVELFREVEAKVCGIDAAEVRSKAKESGSPQLSLGLGGRTQEGHYVRDNRLAREFARRGLLAAVEGGRKPRWSDVWPEIIEAQHLTLRNLHEVVAEMESAGVLTLAGRPRGKRVPTPDTTLAAGSARSGSKIS